MFDANLTFLPEGFKFFATVAGLNEDCTLADKGVKASDVIICTKKCNDPQIITVHFEDGDVDLQADSPRLRSHYVVYEGYIVDHEGEAVLKDMYNSRQHNSEFHVKVFTALAKSGVARKHFAEWG